ncbi:MAG: hypothetical protein IT376_11895 [Polyangiaceae bacterium]|nr:hypothetical protein [Polyangiaceae bacterium]
MWWPALALALETPAAPSDPDAQGAPRLAAPPLLGIALGGFAGLGVETTADGTHGQATAGGELALRVSYGQLVGCVSVSELVASRASTWCVLGGAVLPFVGWADLDLSAGFARRRYESDDTRYGPNGYTVEASALAARAGLSARAGDVAGVRFGAFFELQHDLDTRRVPWAYRLSEDVTVTGKTAVGGTTVSLAVRLAADFELLGR